ncbi:MAG TPA: D-alanyl-D-alanine carboxypeptidase family protein [Ktedonosporobacter sp.]|nr:D-alanyl-D-alanine carboxypeptidase family protein [Ktedonosporobacter sp.]
MYETPPQEDEPSEGEQSSEQTPPLLQGARLARHRHASVPGLRRLPYHSDEHPEIPRVRRASLYIETPAVSPVSSAYQVRTRKPVKQEPDEEPAGTHSSKIMVARRRQTNIYEPPLTTHHRPGVKRKRRPPSLLSHLQRLSQHKALAFSGIVLLVLLVVLPIANNALHDRFSHANPGGIFLSGSNTDDTTSSNGNSGDPHALVITPSDLDHPAPPVFATSAYLLDADTGATLYAHNPFMHLPMLSTTKLMTALLAVEQGNLDQNITITDAIDHDIQQLSADSSVMGIKKGETYTLRDLLYGLMLVSGNDDAVAIADTVSGNLNNFVAKMNQRARQLGLYDTHYMNPHGLLLDGHYSSAHDLALLGRVSLNNTLIHQISATKEYHITQSGNHADHYLINGNQFLWWYPGVDGGKPGWDGATNFVQVISVTRNQHHLIGVTMHTSDWWTDMRDLMNWGLSSFSWISPYDADLQHPIPYDTDWNYFVKDKKENTIPTANQGRYYIYTGFSISGPILAYFDKNNGLKTFGFPIGMAKMLNNTTITQQFEQAAIQCDTSTKACTTI